MISLSRSSRSRSQITTLGWESPRPYSSSAGVHQALTPTAAAPIEIVAQYDSAHSG